MVIEDVYGHLLVIVFFETHLCIEQFPWRIWFRLAYLFVIERTCASKAMFGMILAVRTEKDACFIKNFVIKQFNVDV